jgi:plasmid stabilization system protein ParE
MPDLKRCCGPKCAFAGRHPGRVEGTPELLFLPLPYVAVYRVTEQTIEVWRVYHTSQDPS